MRGEEYGSDDVSIVPLHLHLHLDFWALFGMRRTSVVWALILYIPDYDYSRWEMLGVFSCEENAVMAKHRLGYDPADGDVTVVPFKVDELEWRRKKEEMEERGGGH